MDDVTEAMVEAAAKAIDPDAFIIPRNPAFDDEFWRGQRRRSAVDRARTALEAAGLIHFDALAKVTAERDAAQARLETAEAMLRGKLTEYEWYAEIDRLTRAFLQAREAGWTEALKEAARIAGKVNGDGHWPVYADGPQIAADIRALMPDLNSRQVFSPTEATIAASVMPTIPALAGEAAANPLNVAWCVGRSGNFDLHMIVAANEAEAIKQWIAEWHDPYSCEYSPERCIHRFCACVPEATRMPEWDGKTADQLSGADWLNAGYPTNCIRCGDETHIAVDGYPVGRDAICGGCMTAADWLVFEAENAAPLEAETDANALSDRIGARRGREAGMRCETCQGDGVIWTRRARSERTDRWVYFGPTYPCPHCDGSGIAHCCDGLREQAEAPIAAPQDTEPG